MIRDYWVSYQYTDLIGAKPVRGYGNALKKTDGPLNFQAIRTWTNELNNANEAKPRSCIILSIVEMEIP